jgi:ComEC/Rec2-related protein
VHGQLEVQTLGGEIDDPYGANYGDNVELQGKLQPPTPYTATGVFATMALPRISVRSNGGNLIIAALYHLRTAMANIIAQSLPQPEAALLIAVLLGLRTPALKPLVPFFADTGTIHLIVPSGFKVTVLAGLVVASTRWLYEKRGVSKSSLLPAQKEGRKGIRWIVTALVITCIAAYTILSGGGPAALRAGIMGILLAITPRIGRVYNVYTALALAALLMSLFDPFVLWDVGFQLSFLGTLGIVLLTPYIQQLFRLLERLPFGYMLGEICAATLAAQIATLPIVGITFNIISFIAPFTNILTVPLLGVMVFLGFLIGASGFVFAPPGVFIGWIARPVLWYVDSIVTWCNDRPGAFITLGSGFISSLAWGYYGLLSIVVCFLLVKWPQLQQTQHHAAHSRSRLARRTILILQVSAALIIVLATGMAVVANRSNGQLTITFLSVGPANQPAQGEAVLIQTPDGKTALIDGGPDATSLAQQVDNRLPPWQRSLDAVILTSPRSDHLVGLQDIVSRYQIGKVLDAGMLHPNSGYALWRRTIAERNIPYIQVRQNAVITLGSQVTLQVLWPTSPLHKSSDEERDNGLIFRLSAPHLTMLFLGVAAMSKYALTNLFTTITPDNLQADIVQVVAEAGKDFPYQLEPVLQAAHPSYVIITPNSLNAKQRKANMSPVITLPPLLTQLKAEVEQTAQVGTLEVSDDGNSWNVHAT